MRKYLCTLYDNQGQQQRTLAPLYADGPSQAARLAADLYGDVTTSDVHVYKRNSDVLSRGREPFVFVVYMQTRCESVRHVRGTGPSPERHHAGETATFNRGAMRNGT